MRRFLNLSFGQNIKFEFRDTSSYFEEELMKNMNIGLGRCHFKLFINVELMFLDSFFYLTSVNSLLFFEPLH